MQGTHTNGNPCQEVPTQGTGPLATLAFAILLAAPALAGVPIDGHLDSAYGPALVTQTTQTSTNDNPCGFGGPTRSSSRPAPSWTPFMASSRTACSICSWPET
jgi:hypothetical protein